ncbi:SRPBCC domain-containing protein [Psychromarinibacter halotolerans]|uniref:SRPBCC domain-containing protein n=1 Tax=Psychromarinibacter halotolerans TaxID=1775175 RepID=A0ABV7GUW7_9RHOB|nr:SRPBCC domain-containing protein [Psychromarinibacter halotolerans]MDF0596181.1 SRPBCC domain-containing protein [Psychromarinibacter halotolerans]
MTASAKTAPTPLAPIVKTVTVPLDPKRAFRLFTEEMSDWWPLDSHSLSAQDGTPARSVTVTPTKGGPVFETKPDGTTAPWGRVTEWSPGKRFAMSWHVGQPEQNASHVSVSFDVVADGTKVTLVHDNWDAHGETAAERHAGYVTGWQMVLAARYGAAAGMLVTV